MNSSVGAGQSSTRQLLIDQAGRVLSKAGGSAIFVKDIAEQVHVPAEDAYALFESDEALHQATREFLNNEIEQEILKSIARLPENATAVDRLRAAALGYFTFALEQPSYFAAFTADQASLELDCYQSDFSDYCCFETCSAMNLLLTVTREALEKYSSPMDSRQLVMCVLTMYAHLQGIAHLASEGVLRHLSPTAKRQTFNATLDTLSAGLAQCFENGSTQSRTPNAFVGEALPTDTHLRAADMPQGSDEERKAALLRGAVEAVVELGVNGLHLGSAAERAGLTLSEAEHLIESDDKLASLLEFQLDTVNQTFITQQVMALPEGSTAWAMIKASGFGYLGYALSDPNGFDALIKVASGAIVPMSFEADLTTVTMEEGEVQNDYSKFGQAFAFLMQLVRSGIDETNGPRSPWVLYTQVMALWATAHGLSVLATKGALRQQPLQFCFELLDFSADTAINGMIEILGAHKA